jgi:hypothetical protein
MVAGMLNALRNTVRAHVSLAEMQSPRSVPKTLDAYCLALRQWIDGSADNDEALRKAGVALCMSTREPHMAPEQILVALHARGIPSAYGVTSSNSLQDRRYVHAIRLLMQTYFGLSVR